MKYHVNPETGKVSACRARVKCRFGGSSGSENHFESKPAAETAAEAMMNSKHEFKSVKRTPALKGKSAFDVTKSNIRAGLAKAGLTGPLPEVKSEADIIAKWFGGDRRKYELISRISNPKSELTDATKDSVRGLVRKGATVGFVRDMDALSKAKKSGAATEVSEVDLIEDVPEGKINPRDLASGKLRAF